MALENQKITLWREQIVQENMKKQLLGGGAIGLAALILSGFLALLTWGLYSLAGDSLFSVIFLIVMLVLLWGGVILALIGAGFLICQGIYILQGKYALEVDTVDLLELKSEYELRRSVISRGYRRVLVTNQYVHFAKYGKCKSDRTLCQGQECYLLVILTKKPHILAFWECDQYEIKGA